MALEYPGGSPEKRLPNGYSLSLTAADSRAPSAVPRGDCGRGLHHLAHLPPTRPLTEILGDLGDRHIGHVGQFPASVRRPSRRQGDGRVQERLGAGRQKGKQRLICAWGCTHGSASMASSAGSTTWLHPVASCRPAPTEIPSRSSILLWRRVALIVRVQCAGPVPGKRLPECESDLVGVDKHTAPKQRRQRSTKVDLPAPLGPATRSSRFTAWLGR
jgi:hypothetical protein